MGRFGADSQLGFVLETKENVIARVQCWELHVFAQDMQFQGPKLRFRVDKRVSSAPVGSHLPTRTAIAQPKLSCRRPRSGSHKEVFPQERIPKHFRYTMAMLLSF